MQLDISANVDSVLRRIQGIRDDQIPFALSKALNATAQDVAKDLTIKMDTYIDRPTPFTKTAFMYKSGKFRGKIARKRDLTAIIQVPPAQSSYLKWIIYGGTRQATKPNGIGVPYQKNARLNKYGNVPKRQAGLIKNAKQFIGTVNGVKGVYERRGGKRRPSLKLMHAFEPSVNYKPQFPIHKLADRKANLRIRTNFAREFRAALASAR